MRVMRQFEAVTPQGYPAARVKSNLELLEQARTEAPAGETEAFGVEACSLTKRVMVVSPFPDQVHSLLRSLSAACFDLFTLHDFNAGILRSVQPELLIFDAIPYPHTRVSADEALREALGQTANIHGVPVMYLVDERAMHRLPEVPEGAELLVWPARPQEAMYRINRLVTGYGAGAGGSAQSELRYKDLKVDAKKMAGYRGGNRIDLTKTEYELLVLFLNSDGSVLTRETIFDGLWGSQFLGNSNVVDAHIKSLRKKLKDSAVAPKYIVTVRGAGYRLADDRAD